MYNSDQSKPKSMSKYRILLLCCIHAYLALGHFFMLKKAAEISNFTPEGFPVMRRLYVSKVNIQQYLVYNIYTGFKLFYSLYTVYLILKLYVDYKWFYSISVSSSILIKEHTLTDS